MNCDHVLDYFDVETGTAFLSFLFPRAAKCAQVGQVAIVSCYRSLHFFFSAKTETNLAKPDKEIDTQNLSYNFPMQRGR